MLTPCLGKTGTTAKLALSCHGGHTLPNSLDMGTSPPLVKEVCRGINSARGGPVLSGGRLVTTSPYVLPL